MSARTTEIDLMCVGLLSLDITIKSVDGLPGPEETAFIDTIRMSPAGTAGGPALIAARLGLHSALVSSVGNDSQGIVIKTMMQAEGVNISMMETVDGMPTSTSVIPLSPDGRRPILHMMGASVFTSPSTAAYDALRQTRALHYGGVGLPGQMEGGAAFLAAAKQAGVFVSCDLISQSEDSRKHLRELLPHVDLFMPSLAEVEYLLGTTDLQAAAEAFMAMGAGECIFKLGTDGAAWFSAEEAIQIPAFEIAPVDTTSCGDSFCAGIHAARQRGMNTMEALKFASGTAALVAMDVGTTGKLESLADVENFIKTAKTRA